VICPFPSLCELGTERNSNLLDIAKPMTQLSSHMVLH